MVFALKERQIPAQGRPLRAHLGDERQNNAYPEGVGSKETSPAADPGAARRRCDTLGWILWLLWSEETWSSERDAKFDRGLPTHAPCCT